jgi:hypothetical protein
MTLLSLSLGLSLVANPSASAAKFVKNRPRQLPAIEQTQELTQHNRIILIPLDSRPAAGQFASMIASMANVQVDLPPMNNLGRFTKPGDVEDILRWLDRQDMSKVTAVIVSADMVAYGGLVASREFGVPSSEAIARMRRIIRFKQRCPAHVKLYVFASTMRLAPTATVESAPYRASLARYEELKDRYQRTGDQSLLSKMQASRSKVPDEVVQRYERTRSRNTEVQKALLRMCTGPEIDYLIMGQDDAKPDGPHIQENIVLRKLADDYDLGEKVYFCEGIDQHANILISRALLKRVGWTPKVRIAYSDPDGPRKLALYESKPIEESLRDQLVASGAEFAGDSEEYDYTLYVNTPGRNQRTFNSFLQLLRLEVDQGFPVAVADINFGPDGTSDEKLYQTITDRGRAFKLLAFAGWNTAGNTIGTAIPAANAYLYARRHEVDPLAREVALREFILHRMVGDYAYHKFTRPSAYRLIESLQTQRDEIFDNNFLDVEQFVQRDLSKHLYDIFTRQFMDKTFYAGLKEYRITRIQDTNVALPWPRAYEASVTFKLIAEEAQ